MGQMGTGRPLHWIIPLKAPPPHKAPPFTAAGKAPAPPPAVPPYKAAPVHLLRLHKAPPPHKAPPVVASAPPAKVAPVVIRAPPGKAVAGRDRPAPPEPTNRAEPGEEPDRLPEPWFCHHVCPWCGRRGAGRYHVDWLHGLICPSWLSAQALSPGAWPGGYTTSLHIAANGRRLN